MAGHLCIKILFIFTVADLETRETSTFCILKIMVRHGPSFYRCSLTLVSGENSNGDIAVVHLSEDDQGLAAGQFAAFYQGKTCVGAGIILEFWDDEGFPVCEKALEIASMEDKSKLGEPVKIKVKPEGPQAGIHEKKAGKEVEFEQEVTDSLSSNWMQKLRQKLMQMF